MNYELTDYQGKSMSITPEQASKVAGVAGLIEITINGQTHYLNKANIASIKPGTSNIATDMKTIAPVDNRGKYSPVKEELLKKWRTNSDKQA
jgi:hypothetical protein